MSTELTLAALGAREVIFTPLLDLDASFAKLLFASHMCVIVENEDSISQDALALSYGCSLSHRLPNDFHSLVEDRNGRLFDLQVKDSHDWTLFGIQPEDLATDIYSYNFCSKDAQALTIIHGYRAAYAVLRRKIYLLTIGILEEQIRSPVIRISRKKLLEEWEMKSRDIKQLAQRQINAFVALYEGCVSRQLRTP